MIQAVDGKGLRVSIGDYRPISAYQGGSDLWKPEFQSLIREWTPDPLVQPGDASLGRFLPRVQPEPGNFNSVIFSLYDERGVEVASASRPARRFSIPESERNELLRRYQLLRDRAAAGDVDADKRRAIEAFQLPDPEQEPEFWRVYGPPWRRKLLVVWGCERIHKVGAVPGPTSLPAATALRGLQPKLMPTWASWGLRGGLAVLAILVAMFLMCRVFDLPICGNKDGTVVARGPTESAGPGAPPSGSGPAPPPAGAGAPPSPSAGGPSAGGPGAPPSGPGAPPSGPGGPPRVSGPGGPGSGPGAPPSGSGPAPPPAGAGAPPSPSAGGPSAGGPGAPPSGPGTPPSGPGTAAPVYYPEIVSQDHLNSGLVRVHLRAVASQQAAAPLPSFIWQIDNRSRTGAAVSFDLPARQQPYALNFKAGREAEPEKYELLVGVQPNVSLRRQKR
jgi:hypothetical protein